MTPEELIAHSQHLIKRHDLIVKLNKMAIKVMKEEKKRHKGEGEFGKCVVDGFLIGYLEGIFAGHELADPEFWK